jgi:hypothetical protein
VPGADGIPQRHQIGTTEVSTTRSHGQAKALARDVDGRTKLADKLKREVLADNLYASTHARQRTWDDVDGAGTSW